jgi:hypothetical protein
LATTRSGTLSSSALTAATAGSAARTSLTRSACAMPGHVYRGA